MSWNQVFAMVVHTGLDLAILACVTYFHFFEGYFVDQKYADMLFSLVLLEKCVQVFWLDDK